MTRLLRRLFSIVAFVGVFAWLLTGAIDNEFARAGGGNGGSSEASGAPLEGKIRKESARIVTGGSRAVADPASVPSSRYQATKAHNSVPFRTATPGKAASIRAIRQVFGRRAAPAIRVASCETGGTFYARSVGNAGERGLFQIHPIHFSWAQPARLFDPVWNSRVAYRLSRGGTRWGPWSCRWAA